MNTEKTIDVFLSYAREDSAEATQLFNDLSEAGLNVWFDQESLRPGENWQIAIDTAIRNARYFIALISTNAVGKQGYIQKEIRQAIDVLDEHPENQIYLIPMRLNDCQPSFKRLADLHWTDLFPNWDTGVQKLLRFLVGSSSATISRKLRLDGLYRSKTLALSGTSYASYTKYLRFYSDGLVIAVSSTGSAEQIAHWFTREECKKCSKGYYSLSGLHIRFSAMSREGEIEYDGELLADSLILRSYSHINRHRDVQEFTFTPIAVK